MDITSPSWGEYNGHRRASYAEFCCYPEQVFLNKQSINRWFQIPWRFRDVFVMIQWRHIARIASAFIIRMKENIVRKAETEVLFIFYFNYLFHCRHIFPTRVLLVWGPVIYNILVDIFGRVDNNDRVTRAVTTIVYPKIAFNSPILKALWVCVHCAFGNIHNTRRNVAIRWFRF